MSRAQAMRRRSTALPWPRPRAGTAVRRRKMPARSPSTTHRPPATGWVPSSSTANTCGRRMRANSSARARRVAASQYGSQIAFITCGVGRVCSSIRAGGGGGTEAASTSSTDTDGRASVAASVEHRIDARRGSMIGQLEACGQAARGIPALDPADRPLDVGTRREHQRLHRVGALGMAIRGTQQPAVNVGGLLGRPRPQGRPLDPCDQCRLRHAHTPRDAVDSPGFTCRTKDIRQLLKGGDLMSSALVRGSEPAVPTSITSVRGL